ncbi:MAG: response regulator [Limnospira sp. PMC 1291.21]|uniref:response regulator n=1 Tax=Limnospira TaxID=2596745 RepID=UPI000280464B|nr:MULTISPECIES: response regulator [unclassified Limnospira]EKD07961.1 response regulator receiver modulated PAS/PAC sensor protein [Arthrospira platensis C1]MDT9189598.1 response regulator [Limnospira sp. PMC 894.15]MDT9220441.1 response regulator [Limnospira sp. PMC 1240.20]MDT9230554.1 response regulator [Limnospira sp. PMC 1242.20]MDT9245761.1 response regulator [Limnospira sp. PMC 1249.20]MDT9251134.1 response regulator [Limnospira sp. PMC 1280.21]MDT9261095.1 response regulator [Limno
MRYFVNSLDYWLPILAIRFTDTLMMRPPNTSQFGNILLVDDKPDNLRLLSQMLTEQGYNVRRVTKGKMALITAKASPPDLVLLDIKMPDMDGYEVCLQLKADEITAEIPVIFMSALDELPDQVKAFTIGGVDYITKPFQVEEVLVRVKTQIRRQAEHLAREAQRERALA